MKVELSSWGAEDFSENPVLFLAVGFGRMGWRFAGPVWGVGDIVSGSSSEPEVEGDWVRSPSPIASGGQRDEMTLNHLFEVMLCGMPQETNMQ